jgi:glycosyltransferase involved in cell wall biosynthesis
MINQAPTNALMGKQYRIKAFYPNFFSDELISYVSLRITKYFNDNNTLADVMGTSSNHTVDPFKHFNVAQHNENQKPDARRIYRDAIPLWLWKPFNKILSAGLIHRLAEYRFLNSLRKTDIAYLWPGSSLWLYRRVKAKGCRIVTEMINTMQSTSKMILDREYNALNIPFNHTISQQDAEKDIEAAKLSDFIFSPSPGVSDSIISAGIEESKILASSYGLKKQEILNHQRNGDGGAKLTLLFVGQICVRKGIHLLLDAWTNAHVDGKLRIVGRISPEISDLFDKYLKGCTTIEHVPYVNDLKPIYKGADIFILPSLEEGSPLVTYLALGAAMPIIASPMGAGGVITDGKEGAIVDPHDREQLIGAIQALFNSPRLRKEMSLAAGEKAEQYTWDKVAARRKKLLLEKIS